MVQDAQCSNGILENAKFRTEIEILCLAARVHLSDATLRRLEDLLLRSIDWQYLVRLARYHKVSPLLYKSLGQLSRSAVPDSIMKEINLESKLRTVRNLFMTRELINVVADLQQVGITVIPFKGPVLAHAAYGDLSLRSAADLDIWVHPSRSKEVQDWLETKGFELKQSLPWECLLRNAQTKIDIDLHKHLTPVQFPINLSFNDVANRLQSLELAGKEVKQLSPEDTLIVQCIGWCKDAWGWSAKLSQLCDIAELLRSHPNLDWEYIEQTNQKLDTHYIVSLPLSLAHDWLDSPLPSFTRTSSHTSNQQVEESSHLQRLSQYASQQFWQYGTAVNENTPARLSTRDHTFYFGIRTSLAARANYTIKQVFVSTEKERALVDLPIHIPGLYIVVRLFRLLRKYAEYYMFRHS